MRQVCKFRPVLPLLQYSIRDKYPFFSTPFQDTATTAVLKKYKNEASQQAELMEQADCIFHLLVDSNVIHGDTQCRNLLFTNDPGDANGLRLYIWDFDRSTLNNLPHQQLEDSALLTLDPRAFPLGYGKQTHCSHTLSALQAQLCTD